jgi:hypothetical protein
MTLRGRAQKGPKTQHEGTQYCKAMYMSCPDKSRMYQGTRARKNPSITRGAPWSTSALSLICPYMHPALARKTMRAHLPIACSLLAWPGAAVFIRRLSACLRLCLSQMSMALQSPAVAELAPGCCICSCPWFASTRSPCCCDCSCSIRSRVSCAQEHSTHAPSCGRPGPHRIQGASSPATHPRAPARGRPLHSPHRLRLSTGFPSQSESPVVHRRRTCMT